MKSIKKTICIALAVILAFTAFPFTSFAESYESFVITEPNVISEDGLWKYGLYKDENGIKFIGLYQFLKQDLSK